MMNELIEIKEADSKIRPDDFPGGDGFYLINKNCIFMVKGDKVYIVSFKNA